ncbi:MAG: DUF1573 domain-containing protein, partial [Verrucomicrobia bacterium]|nr:DUF1573 domain-containing protein [Verrucomicrobiota bacterium]
SANKVTVDFEFTNRSDKPVSVIKYDSTCSCMSVRIQDGKLRYAPGESGLVRADFDMGNFSGSIDKVVVLWLDKDAADKPSIVLKVRVIIPVLVSLEPKTVKWELNGKAEPQTIRVTMHHVKPIRVTSVQSSSEAFKCAVKTIQDGASYDVIVTPMNINTPGLGIFRIETDCDIEKHRIQQAFGTVRRPLPANSEFKP